MTSEPFRCFDLFVAALTVIKWCHHSGSLMCLCNQHCRPFSWSFYSTTGNTHLQHLACIYLIANFPLVAGTSTHCIWWVTATWAWTSSTTSIWMLQHPVSLHRSTARCLTQWPTWLLAEAHQPTRLQPSSEWRVRNPHHISTSMFSQGENIHL